MPQLPGVDGRVDLEKLLTYLGERNITCVTIEGGGILLGSLFDLKLVDKVIAYIAPLIIGGAEAKSPRRQTRAWLAPTIHCPHE